MAEILCNTMAHKSLGFVFISIITNSDHCTTTWGLSEIQRSKQNIIYHPKHKWKLSGHLYPSYYLTQTKVCENCKQRSGCREDQQMFTYPFSVEVFMQQKRHQAKCSWSLKQESRANYMITYRNYMITSLLSGMPRTIMLHRPLLLDEKIWHR